MSDKSRFVVPTGDDGLNADPVPRDGIYSATFIPPLDSSYRTQSASIAPDDAPAVTDLGAIQGTEGGSAAPNLDGVPVTEIKPGDVGTLSLRYVDGAPQLVVSGGTVLPAALTVVDASGKAVASYTAGSTDPATAANSDRSLNLQASSIITGVIVDIDYQAR